MIEEFEKKMLKHLEDGKLLENIETIAVFGSATNGTIENDSDFDLLIIASDYSQIKNIKKALEKTIADFKKDGLFFYLIGSFYLREFKRTANNAIPIHVLFYAPLSFKEVEKPEVINSILKCHRIVYGKPLDEFTNPINDRNLRTKLIDLKQIAANGLFNILEDSEASKRMTDHIAGYITKYLAAYFPKNSQKIQEINNSSLNSDDKIQFLISFIEELENNVKEA